MLAIPAVLLVTVLWYVFLVSPKNSKIDDLEQEITTAQDEAQGLRAQKAALEAIKDSELTYRSAIAGLQRSVPAAPELAEFIEAINQIAVETGVDLSSLSPGTPQITEGEAFATIPVNMTVSAQFFELLGFFFAVSDMDRVVRIDSLTLSSSVVEDEVVLSAAINASMFTLATNLPTPSLEPPVATSTTTTTVPGSETTTTTVVTGGTP